ncbi:MAG: lipoprotein signal peptidase [Bacteroidia bacterium]|nr:lipoprotein signal peptidase [Bacteroidia bacterium]
MSIRLKVIALVVGVLVLDQVVKILVKTHMSIGETIPVFGNWFLIHFVENKGMAFGVTWGGVAGKIALTVFRIIAVATLSYFIHRMIKKDMPVGFILALALITAGAAGNIIDSAFYGLIFNESTYANGMIAGSGVAEFLPKEGGYGPFLQGAVVDMLYFPVINTTWPHWVPFWGGQSLTFFRPIFNLADSAITCGVFWVLIFHRRSLRAI